MSATILLHSSLATNRISTVPVEPHSSVNRLDGGVGNAKLSSNFICEPTKGPFKTKASQTTIPQSSEALALALSVIQSVMS